MGNPHPKNSFKDHPENINRKGRPSMSKEMKALRKYAAGEIIETFEKVVRMTIKEASEWVNHPECSLLDYTLIIAMKKGNLDLVLNRILGKVPETVNLNTIEDDEKIDISKLSEEEKQELIRKKLKSLKGK